MADGGADREMEAALAFLRAHRRIAVTAHERPDGDALGSALALARILRRAGREAAVYDLEPYPPAYTFLPEPGELKRCTPDALAEADGLVVLDCGAADRTAETFRREAARKPLLNIDHHTSNTRFGSAHWIDPEASSVGEMVIRLARAAGWAVPPAAAEAAWVAIVTDTGKFAYGNTRADTLRTAADLVDLGADPARCERLLFQSREPAELALLRRALESLRLHAGGRCASVGLSREDFSAFDAGPQHAQEIVNLPRSLRGVEAAFFFYELPQEEGTKASVRTDPPLDAAELCARFGGGGHARAAGCRLEAPLDETRRTVLAAARELWFSDAPADEGKGIP